MKRTTFLFSLLLSCTLIIATDHTALPQMAPLTVEQAVSKGDPFRLEWETFSLSADSGALMHDITIRFSVFGKEQAQQMPSNMGNVTGQVAESFCLLPNGVHFEQPAVITVPYDIHRLPAGYNTNDIFTFYYDEDLRSWKKLERMGIDTVLHTVSSYTTHFTEFANAVIKVPEMPEAKAFVPTAMTDLPDVNPLQGIPMIAAPQANNRGTAELTYPIDLPKGRRGLQPNIDLHYSSAAGNGILGIGWDINVPAITIDTRWGVPRYDPFLETEAYLLNGEQVLLHDSADNPIPLSHQSAGFEERRCGSTRFYARDRKNQDHIIRCGTSPTDYYWVVTDRTGTKYYYGYDPIAKQVDENAMLRTWDRKVAKWSISAIVDVFGNYIQYTYERDNYNLGADNQFPLDSVISDGNDHYLVDIAYTGNFSSQADSVEILPFYHVAIEYAERPDNILDGRLGFLRNTHKRICTVKLYADTAIIASYKMDYDCSSLSLNKSRLSSVTKYDAQEVYYCEAPDKVNPDWKKFIQSQDSGFLAAQREYVGEDTDWAGEASRAYAHGSKTDFDYYNAHPINSLFNSQNPHIAQIDDIGRNVRFGAGGGADFGIGVGSKGTTDMSLGINGSLQYGTGRSRSMLMDMNGDGLPDYVYTSGNDVYYRKQAADGSFAAGKKVEGLSHLVVDHSLSYDLGVQGQVGIVGFNAKAVAFTNSFTSAYFTDVNNDHLPDLIDNKHLYICRLDSHGDPMYELQESDYIPVHSGSCSKYIIRDGYVDEKLECRNYYVLDTLIEYINSEPYAPAIIRPEGLVDSTQVLKRIPVDDPHYVTAGVKLPLLNTDELESRPLYRKEVAIGDYREEYLTSDNNPRLAQIDSLRRVYPSPAYKLECNDDKIHVYRLESDCSEESPYPNVDVVRIWVAPHDGSINLQSSIHLLNDSSENRAQSRYLNGVGYAIQRSRPVYNLGNSPLRSQSDVILSSGTILPSETDTISAYASLLSVEEGDILMFRLSALGNRSFDDVEWVQEISYIGESVVYNSSRDFFCWEGSCFVAPYEGNATLNLRAVYQMNGSVAVNVLVNDTVVESVSITNDSTNLSLSRLLNAGDSIQVEVNYSQEPVWSRLSVLPEVVFTSAGASDSLYSSLTCPFGYSIIGSRDSIYSGAYAQQYKDLFGPLHKGWGQFGFNNVYHASVISLDSLSNYYSDMMQAFSQDTASQGERLRGISSMTRRWKERLQGLCDRNSTDSLMNAVSADSLKANTSEYDAFSDERRWVAVSADMREKKWIVLGNLGALGAELQSTSIQRYNQDEREEVDYVEFDSSIPVMEDSAQVKTIIKRRFSWNPGASLSVGIGSLPAPNFHVSGGLSNVSSDYLDLNGDGYPDFVGYNSVQFSTPWGGIGQLSVAKRDALPWQQADFEHFASSDLAFGTGVSGSFPAISQQVKNNVKANAKFTSGFGADFGESWSDITYMDVNGDGLPDRVSRRQHKVCYNIGYSFVDAVDFMPDQDIDAGTSISYHNTIHELSEAVLSHADLEDILTELNPSSSLDFGSIDQFSFSAGVSCSESSNRMYQMVDVDGDGFLDQIHVGNSSLSIAANNGNHGWRSSTNILSGSGNEFSSSTTTNIGASGSFTIISPLPFYFKFVTNPQINLINASFSFTDLEWMDMNGDGYVDLLLNGRSNNNDSLYPIVFYNANGLTPVNHLRKVTNPTGQSVSLSYQKSRPTIDHAGCSWLLCSVRDSLPQEQIIDDSAELGKNYLYTTAVYDHFEKTDYGYADVETIESYHFPDGGEEKYRRTKQSYKNRAFLTKGDLTREALMDGTENLYIVKIHQTAFGLDANNLTNDVCNDLNLKPYKEEYFTEYYDLLTQAVRITSRYTLEYDSLHNLIKRTDDGDIADPADDLVQNITYYSNPSRISNLVSLPIAETIIAVDGASRSSSMTYNYAFGVPTNITRRNGTENITTSIVYDVYGNPIQMQMPADSLGRRGLISYVYDTRLRTYPIRITNEFGESHQTRYDLRLGLPLETADASGYSIKYKYDPIGRLTDVIAPNEQPGDSAFTVHYDYRLPFYYLEDANGPIARNCGFSHVTKIMSSRFQPHAGAECTLYNARGTEVQKKSHLQVEDTMSWVVNGLTYFDCLGRMIRSTDPFVSSAALGAYDSNHPDPRVTKIEYDPFDRKTAVIYPDLSSVVYSYGFSHDVDNIVRFSQITTNENGVKFEQLSSPQEWTIQQNNPEEQTTFYQYNALGELMKVTDADGYTTRYHYDMLGQLTRRTHPDAGETIFEYDALGNLTSKTTANLTAQATGPIKYKYLHNRLIEVRYPIHPDLDVSYTYDSNGHLVHRSDGAGTEDFDYDPLGNVSTSKRWIYIPTESYSYELDHQYSYDSFGRMLHITYPDQDEVSYNYYNSGQLSSVSHTYQNVSYSLVDSLKYDESGQKILVGYGNGVVSQYGYDPNRNRLLYTRTSLPGNVGDIQDLRFKYDAVGNITQITQQAGRISGLGGAYENTYSYNDLNQLDLSQSIGGAFDYDFSISLSPAGRIGEKSLRMYTPNPMYSDLIYGYAKKANSHQARVIFDNVTSTSTEMYWDADGNLMQMVNCKTGGVYTNWWDEDDHLRMVVTPNSVGYYGYDANGQRVYKLTGPASQQENNAAEPEFSFKFEGITVYPSPYLTFSEKGYSKHFYAGAERIATLIGDGGLDFRSNDDQPHQKIISTEFEKLKAGVENYLTPPITENEDIHHKSLKDIQYDCYPFTGVYYAAYSPENIFGTLLARWTNTPLEIHNEIFYTHTNHLGSASWITDNAGTPVQYIHYAPYGELIANQRASGYDERFKFTGKERDQESGYDYFGARFLWSPIGIWLSVDPLADKYIQQSPYLYCNGNPIKYIDTDGKGPLTALLINVFIEYGSHVGETALTKGVSIGEAMSSVTPKDYGKIGAKALLGTAVSSLDGGVTRLIRWVGKGQNQKILRYVLEYGLATIQQILEDYLDGEKINIQSELALAAGSTIVGKFFNSSYLRKSTDSSQDALEKAIRKHEKESSRNRSPQYLKKQTDDVKNKLSIFGLDLGLEVTDAALKKGSEQTVKKQIRNLIE